ncbi:MAG: hypothetical protein IPG13_16240 [Rhodocyclaceae bacterium]|nr:hypothetical protein [Rhodocyclaceae bacterium]
MSGTDTHDTLRLLEADGAATGQVWQATLIQAGLSANQVYYADAVLREAVSRFDGARIYVKSDADHLKGASKDVRQLVGWVSQPRFVEGAAADGGRIEAAIHLPGLPDDIRKLLIEAHKAGRANLIGLSIDATGSAGAPGRRPARAGGPEHYPRRFRRFDCRARRRRPPGALDRGRSRSPYSTGGFHA